MATETIVQKRISPTHRPSFGGLPRILVGRRALLWWAGSGLALAGCSTATTGTAPASGSSGQAAAPAVTLRWGVSTAPDIVDGAHGFGLDNAVVQGAVLEGPVGWDLTGTVVPMLAESWTEPEPGTYVFTLRPGLKFSDGSPVTVDDVVYSLTRHQDPAVGSGWSSWLADLKSARATGKLEVTVELAKPSPLFLYLAAFVWQVVPQAMAKAHLKDLGTASVGVIGTGPFKITTFSGPAGMTLDSNEHYWGTRPAVRTVNIVTITNTEALRLAIDSGDIDAARIPMQDSRRWDALKSVTSSYYSMNSVLLLGMNVKHPQLSDLNVRKAIAHAVNRPGIAKLSAGDHAIPTNAFLPGLMLKPLFGDTYQQVVDALPDYDQNLAKAKDFMAKSAYPNGFEITVDYPTGTHDKSWESIVNDLKAIGILITLNPLTSDAYYARAGKRENLNLTLGSRGGITSYVGEILPDLVGSKATEPNGLNYTDFSSPAIDADLTALESAQGDAQRPPVQRILDAVSQQLPYLAICEPQGGVALSRKYSGEFSVYTRNYVATVKATA